MRTYALLFLLLAGGMTYAEEDMSDIEFSEQEACEVRRVPQVVVSSRCRPYYYRHSVFDDPARDNEVYWPTRRVDSFVDYFRYYP